MAPIVLVGKDWRLRALLRAQLIEEGLDVEAYETAGDALASFAGRGTLPGILVADLAESGDPATEIESLAGAARQFPVWLITRRGLIGEEDLARRGFESVLFRPLDFGELVERIKQRLAASGQRD